MSSDWHDNFGRNMLVTMVVLFFFGVMGFTCYTQVQCINACGSDPVSRCYPDRTVCVGTEHIYVRPIK
jgi:hypothetical protein